jgi:hypothetical protein
LSDAEEPSFIQQQLSKHLKHAANLLQDFPHIHHGLPMFDPSADYKSERRDGASRTNYMGNPLQDSFKPLRTAASDLTQPRSGSRSAASSNHRNSRTKSPASLKDFSKIRVLGNTPQEYANVAKRRKTNIDFGSPARRRTGATSASLGSERVSGSTTERISEPADPTAGTARTIITGESRLQSSYSLLRSSNEEEYVPNNDENNGSGILLQKVLELIRFALRPYRDLASEDRNSVAEKVKEQKDSSIGDPVY